MQRLLSGKASTDSEALHSQWSSSIIPRQIDQLLSGAEVDSPPEQSLLDVDSSWVNDPRDPNAPKLDTQIPRANSSNRRTLSTPDQFPPTHKTLSGPSASRQPTVPSAIPSNRLLPSGEGSESTILRLPANFWKLLDTYYAYTHPWLPISDKNDILKTAYSYGTEGKAISTETISSGLHAELWAIVTLASCQVNTVYP